MRNTARYLLIISIPLAELLMVLALRQSIGERLAQHWHASPYILEIVQRQFYMGLLPVPAAFLLWLAALEREGRFNLQFSPLAMGISVAAFAGMHLLYLAPYLMQCALALAVVSACFIFVPLTEWWPRALKHKRLALVALLAATSATGFYWVMRSYLSYQLLYWTGMAASATLSGLGIDNLFVKNMEYLLGFDLYSSHYAIILAPFCCGFEGMFMMGFMLSALLLAGWERFQRCRLWIVYGLGIIVIFLLNVLRIVVFFALGDRAFNPAAPDWVQSLQGAPFELFHSYAGWAMYMAAFAAFAAWLYRATGKRSSGDIGQ